MMGFGSPAPNSTFVDALPGNFGTMGGGGMTPALRQAMMASQGQLAPPPASNPQAPQSFEQQVMSRGGYTTPPAQNQNPWLQNQQGISPQLQAMLSQLPPRPTGLPPGMMSAPQGAAPGTPPGTTPPPGVLTDPTKPTQPNANDHGINADHTNHAMGGPVGASTGGGFSFGGHPISLSTAEKLGLTGASVFGGLPGHMIGAAARGFVGLNNAAYANHMAQVVGAPGLSLGQWGQAALGYGPGRAGYGRGVAGFSGANPAGHLGGAMSATAADKFGSMDRGGWGGGHDVSQDHAGGGHTNGQDKDAAGRDAARN